MYVIGFSFLVFKLLNKWEPCQYFCSFMIVIWLLCHRFHLDQYRVCMRENIRVRVDPDLSELEAKV